MPSSNYHGIRGQRVLGVLIVACALADFFPRHDAPLFRYTGSDSAVEVWNFGWPLVLSIFDPQSGIHIGPFFYVVVPFQLLAISIIGVVFAFWTQHNTEGCVAAKRSGVGKYAIG
ncbi:MAG: hypothetical protein ACTHLW_10065 [Verrucomicrobiota bacterium]